MKLPALFCEQTKKLTKLKLIPVTSKHRWDTPVDASAVIVTHRLLSSAMSNNDDSDRPVHFLLLYLHALRGLSLRVCGAVAEWLRRSLLTRHALRRTHVRSPDSNLTTTMALPRRAQG